MSRGRSRTRTVRILPLAVLLVAVLFVGATVLPAASYSTGDVGREASLGVADDPQAILGLDTASGVRIGHTDRLVVVTNNLDGAATVTVTLSGDSATKADLVVGGSNAGDEYTVDLNRFESSTVDVSVGNDTSYVGESIVFDTSADGIDIDAVATNRSAQIEDSTT
jgi:hypothetical protein